MHIHDWKKIAKTIKKEKPNFVEKNHFCFSWYFNLTFRDQELRSEIWISELIYSVQPWPLQHVYMRNKKENKHRFSNSSSDMFFQFACYCLKPSKDFVTLRNSWHNSNESPFTEWYVRSKIVPFKPLSDQNHVVMQYACYSISKLIIFCCGSFLKKKSADLCIKRNGRRYRLYTTIWYLPYCYLLLM